MSLALQIPMPPTRRERPDVVLLYEGREAELIWAYRRSLALGTGGARAALRFARSVTGEKYAPKGLDTSQTGAIISPAWDLTSSD